MTGVPASLTAQVRIGATASTFVFSGATDGADPTVRPHGSYAWGGAASFQRHAWTARLGIAASSPGLIVGDDAVQITDRSVLGLLVVEPAVARRVLTAGTGGTLWVEAGPSMHRWTPYGEDPRTRWGAVVASVWRQAATHRLDLSVRAHVSASPSPFTEDDLPDELQLATLWRWGVTLELGWRL